VQAADVTTAMGQGSTRQPWGHSACFLQGVIVFRVTRTLVQAYPSLLSSREAGIHGDGLPERTAAIPMPT